MEELLTVSGLSKTFHLSKKQQKLEKTTEKVKVAVDDLSFCTYRGEVFGLLGPNGAGKTTTLRMLATLIKPDKGDALIDGSSIVTDPNGVRKKIGFLTSELKLEEFFTPNYLFDFFSELYGVDQAERDERKRILFQKFGVDEFAEVKVANLSTGMKQKVSLIISLVHDPQIIIFDEPTNGLDVITAKVVTDFLQELKAEGKTIIVSTHIFSLIEKICDRVGIIINGKMVLCDTLSHVTAEMPLEDKFFEIYRETAGGDSMSKKMIAIMKKEFARFFGDKRLVFTTILMPGLMIYILYTLLGQGIMKQFAASEDYVYQIYTVDLPEAFSYLKTESDLEVTEITVEKESDVLEKIEAEEADLLMVFQSDFDAAVAAYDPLDTTQAAPDINMYYNSVSTESSTIYNQMYQVFDDYESSLANKFDINAEEGVKYDVATEKDTSAQLFSMLLPMLLMSFLFSGCMAVAPESIVGEKERGTIATLLVTPMKRSELAVGKVLSLSVIGLLGGVSSFIGTMLALPNLMGGAALEDDSMTGAMSAGSLQWNGLCTVVICHFKYGSGNYRCNLPDVRPGKERQRGRNDGFASDDRRHADRCVDDVRGWCAEGGLLVSDPVL